jgi:hypothetical protein
MRVVGQVFCLAIVLNLTSSPSAIAQLKPGPDGAVSQTSPNQSEGLQSAPSKRADRRLACQKQAHERGLSGRMARRFNRLCLSGLPVPKPIRPAQ